MKMRSLGWWLTALNVGGAIASIIALVVAYVVPDPAKATLALVVVLLLLLGLFAKAYHVLSTYLRRKYPNGYACISNIARYVTLDGYHVHYDIFKHIHCKQTIMSTFDYGFNWTGKLMPEVSSDLQDVVEVIKTPSGDYDRARLQFRKPLLYNDVGIIHVSLNADDVDRQSKPHVDFKVIEPMQLLHWRIELRYLPEHYNQPAKLLMRPISDAIPGDYIEIATVSFDAASRSYDHHVFNPKPGYYYRLAWERS